MDLVHLRIPYAFIRDRVRMNWRELLFGLQQELLDPAAPAELAADLVDDQTSDVTLIELAGLSANDDARECVEALAAREPEEGLEQIRAKWLYVVLAWIFEHRHDYADPLRAVEEAYADFDYPSRIASFVRYMPSDAPDLGSRELNEARLYNKWQSYLQECQKTYVANRAGAR